MSNGPLQNPKNGLIPEDEITKVLPTTFKLAKLGVDAYAEVYRTFPSHLRSIFLQYHWFKTCFVGTTPQKEMGYLDEQLSPDDLNTLIQTIHSKTNFIRFYYPYADEQVEQEENKLALLNLHAADRVVKSNQDFFPPEAVADPRGWLLDNLSEWAQSGNKTSEKQARYGLLSGFPNWSVKKYEKFLSMGGKVNSYGEDSKNSMEAKKIGNDMVGMYIGFDKEKDQKYVQKLEEIYEASGIDNVAEKLKEER